jgi:hypothetical protein
VARRRGYAGEAAGLRPCLVELGRRLCRRRGSTHAATLLPPPTLTHSAPPTSPHSTHARTPPCAGAWNDIVWEYVDLAKELGRTLVEPWCVEWAWAGLGAARQAGRHRGRSAAGQCRQAGHIPPAACSRPNPTSCAPPSRSRPPPRPAPCRACSVRNGCLEPCRCGHITDVPDIHAGNLDEHFGGGKDPLSECHQRADTASTSGRRRQSTTVGHSDPAAHSTVRLRPSPARYLRPAASQT